MLSPKTLFKAGRLLLIAVVFAQGLLLLTQGRLNADFDSKLPQLLKKLKLTVPSHFLQYAACAIGGLQALAVILLVTKSRLITSFVLLGLAANALVFANPYGTSGAHQVDLCIRLIKQIVVITGFLLIFVFRKFPGLNRPKAHAEHSN